MLPRIPLALLALAAAPFAQIQDGDVVVNFFGSPAALTVYRPDGTQVVTTTGGGTGGQWEGAAYSPSGQLVTSRRLPSSGVNVFDQTGAEVMSFASTGTSFVPADVDLFSDGSFAVGDQAGDVDVYDPTGALQATYVPLGACRAFGLHIDGNDDLWMGDTMAVGQDNGAIWHFDRNGSFLGGIQTTFEVGDLVVADDGTIWASDRNNGVVMHLDALGNLLGSFQAIAAGQDFSAIGLASDGTLWVTGDAESQLYHYDPFGALLGTIPIAGTGTPLFLTVVNEKGLVGTPDQVSLSSGGSQVLSMTMGTGLAGKAYQIIGSASGTMPGITFSGVNVPLNFDPYWNYTFLNPNSPILNGSAGTLNSLGQATAVFTLAPGTDPALAGLTVHHAGVVLGLVSGSLVLLDGTNAEPVLLVP